MNIKSSKHVALIMSRQYRNTRLSLLLAVAFFAAQDASLAAQLYVAPWGGDGNPGTLTLPYKTIQKAANRLKPGDTLNVRGGIYVERVSIYVNGTGTSPIVITAYPGERPIIDGQNKLADNWWAMVNMRGNFLVMSGLEIRNSLGLGVHIIGKNNTLTKSNVHGHAAAGVKISGDFGTVEFNRVWGNAWDNCRLSTCPPTQFPNGGWGYGLSAGRPAGVGSVTHNAIMRKNTVYNNWGEGVMAYEADGTLIEGNVSYDNWAVNLYVDNAPNTLVSGNLVYRTPNNRMARVGGDNVSLCDELGPETGAPVSQNITIINNLVKGGGANLGWWADPRNPKGIMKNVLIAHNSFIEAVPSSNSPGQGSIRIRSADHQNVRFANNIVKQDGFGNPISVGTGDIRFSNNLWSKSPVTSALTSNDVLADPQLTAVGSTGAGRLTANWFRLKATSPAIDRGEVISTIMEDYYNAPRDTNPDIGGHEFQKAP